MITVYSAVKIYCEQNQLPILRRHDLHLVGRNISTHFKRFWGVNQSSEIISQAGFLISEEQGKPLIVVGYPDCFLEDMLARIHIYFENKKNQPAKESPVIIKQNVTPLKKNRKRIPIPPTPTKRYSAKPTNPIL